jgi:hypothetical protein
VKILKICKNLKKIDIILCQIKIGCKLKTECTKSSETGRRRRRRRRRRRFEVPRPDATRPGKNSLLNPLP